jgi:putative drug exporter of the RND superfamily
VFSTLGRIVGRAWFLLLAGWVLALVVTWLAAPPWAEVAQAKEFDFLPPDSPSRRSAEVFARAFPDDHLASNVVLVVHRAEGEPGCLDRDLKSIENVLEPGLRAIAAAEGGLADQPPSEDEPLFPDDTAPAPPPQQRSIIARIRTPNAPGTGTLLVSEDERVLLVVVELTTEFLSSRNWPIIARIEGLVDDLRRQGKFPPS